ncbi:endonuclease-reverse transcriptase [Plakobranchus ocellatus]|uniref:Endonuclease-reverse transcriptase n=1 Tax=Plakobranchus ocellatus TaxID=259542 RepID=A0AAV3Z4C5_9GAST|nr:endonuclease-reverse transcriptase [Plakobranchus ocellatus]
MKNIWTEAAENTLGKKKSMKKKPWISTETIELANEKRKARKNNEKVKYIRLRNEIKYKIRNDKREWLEKECAQIQEFDTNNKAKQLFEKNKNNSTFRLQATPTCYKIQRRRNSE